MALVPAASAAAADGDAVQPALSDRISAAVESMTTPQKALAAGAMLAVVAGSAALITRRLRGDPPSQLDDDPATAATGTATAAGGAGSSGSSTKKGGAAAAGAGKGDGAEVESSNAADAAKKLKDRGNRLFRKQRFKESVQAYSMALELTQEGDRHVILSNRAAAQTSLHDYEAALADAEEVIRLRPDWPKGYFRKGKALLNLGQAEEAYVTFYLGLKEDSSSQELQKMMDIASQDLSVGDLDTRSKVETQITEKHMHELAAALCGERLGGVSYEDLRKVVLGPAYKELDLSVAATKAEREDQQALAKDAPSLDAIYASPVVARAVAAKPRCAHRVVAQILLFEIRDRFDDARSALEQSLAAEPIVEADEEDGTGEGADAAAAAAGEAASALLRTDRATRGAVVAGPHMIMAHLVLRAAQDDKTDKKAAIAEIRVALKAAPTSVVVAHTFASILVGLNPSEPSPLEWPELFTVLEELIPALQNQHANRMLVADAGLRLWFRLFDSPDIKARFEQEERDHFRREKQTPEREALIMGLESGSYSILLREPFFLEVLANITLVNTMLERLLVPFRQAVALEKRGNYGDDVAPFCYALALQCFRNGYVWPVTEEEERLIVHFTRKLRRALEDEDQRAALLDADTKQLTPQFRNWLGFVSLYRNVDAISPKAPGALAQILRSADLSNEHKWFVELLHRAVLDRDQERELMAGIPTVTPMPADAGAGPAAAAAAAASAGKSEDDVAAAAGAAQLQQYYDSHLHPLWNVVQPSVSTHTIGQEMSWLFPHHDFKGWAASASGTAAHPDRVLVAGCGAGSDIQQLSVQYSNIRMTGVDISKPNLAFAQRQCAPEGVAEFVHANLLALEPGHVGGGEFDLCVALNVLHHLTDPVGGFKRLAACLRDGGLFTGTVYSRRYIQLLREARIWLNSRFTPAVFNVDAPDMPTVLRQPSDDELRAVRTDLFNKLSAANLPWAQGQPDTPPKELIPLMNMPAFFNLDQFRDLLFHPHVCGFDFTTLAQVLDEAGLSLVSFEFPTMPQDAILRYRADHPDDPHLKNPTYLDQWDLESEIVPITISPHFLFVAEKKGNDGAAAAATAAVPEGKRDE